MLSVKPCKSHYYRSPFLSAPLKPQDIKQVRRLVVTTPRKLTSVRRCSSSSEQEDRKSSERRTFLTLEEAGLVEISGLGTHERFLCRLTVPYIYSLPLLVYIYLFPSH